MPVELTDEEAAAARRAVQIIQALGNNPDARKHLERGLKAVEPKFTTSDDVIETVRAPLREEIEALRKEREDEKAAAAEEAKKAAEEAAIRRIEDGFGRLRQQEGLTAEGEEKVREIMKDRSVYDPEAAFALFEKQNPRPTPEQSSWIPDRWNSPVDGMPDVQSWFKDEDRAADEAINSILADERRKSSDS